MWVLWTSTAPTDGGGQGSTGMLGVEAGGLIKHQPHCRGAPEGPHQGAPLAVVLLHSLSASLWRFVWTGSAEERRRGEGSWENCFWETRNKNIQKWDKKKVCCWLVLSCKIKMLSRRKSQRGQRWRGKRKKVRGQIKIIQIKKEKHHRGTVTVWAPDNDRSCPCRLTVDSCRADAAAAAWTDSSHSKIRFSSNILHTLIRAVSPCCISATPQQRRASTGT